MCATDAFSAGKRHALPATSPNVRLDVQADRMVRKTMQIMQLRTTRGCRYMAVSDNVVATLAHVAVRGASWSSLTARQRRTYARPTTSPHVPQRLADVKIGSCAHERPAGQDG